MTLEIEIRHFHSTTEIKTLYSLSIYKHGNSIIAKKKKKLLFYI